VQRSRRRFQTMRFACALPFHAQGASAFRSTAVKAGAFATALRNASPKGLVLPRSDSGGCPSPLSFGPIPLQRRHRRRKRLDCRALGGCANPRRARGRVSCAAASAHRLRRLPVAELSPHSGSTTKADPARVASDPHRALEAAGCFGLTPISVPACAETATPARSASTDDRGHRLEPRRARTEPQHPRIRDAIRAALAFDPTAQVIDVAADVDRARSLGGDHREEACSTGSARRLEATCGDVRPDTVQRARSARPRPKTEHVWRSSTEH